MPDQSRQAKYISNRRKRGDAVTITVLIPAEMKSQMDDAADASGMTRKDWIAAAISEKLHRSTKPRHPKKTLLSIALLLCGLGAGGTISQVFNKPASAPTISAKNTTPPPAETTTANSHVHTIQASDTVCRPITVIRTFARSTPSINGSQGSTEIIRRTSNIGCGTEQIISEKTITLPN